MSNKPQPTTVIGDTAYSLVSRPLPTKAQYAALRYNELIEAANRLTRNDPSVLQKSAMPIPRSNTFLRVTPKMSRKTARRMHTRNPVKLQKEIARELAVYDAA